MTRHIDLGNLVLQELKNSFPIRKNDIGEDAVMSRKGMHFQTDSYEIADIGHLCILRMKAMLGLMKMETVVLSVFDRDVPLVNLDWISAFGKETQLNELYDTQISPYPQEKLD